LSIICPKCGSEIDQDFGIVTCANCDSVFSVDVDGQIQESHAEEVIEVPDGLSPELPIEAIFETVNEEYESVIPDTPEQAEVIEPLQQEQIQQEEIAQSPQSVFQEITEFGNKEIQAGPLSYTVYIEDIEIKERIEEVLLALSDPKFGWDQAYLKKNLKAGILKLENLNPAQAVMLIRNLRGINVKISWSQSLYA